MVTIAKESPRQDDILALLAQSDAYSASRYPGESQFLVGVDFLDQPRVRFFVARDGGRAVGCGALVVKDGGRAEIKRMIVDASARGKGVGWQILEAIEGAAREAGVARIRLETGPESREALSLYRRAGYRERGPFSGYPDSPTSIFMEKRVEG